jgi:hypothetical protein
MKRRRHYLGRCRSGETLPPSRDRRLYFCMVLLLSAEMYTTDMSLLVAIWGCRLSPWVKVTLLRALKSAAVGTGYAEKSSQRAMALLDLRREAPVVTLGEGVCPPRWRSARRWRPRPPSNRPRC